MNAARYVDRYLLAVPRRAQLAAILITLIWMVWQSLPNVPRAFVDFSRIPALHTIAQPESFGTDTIADTYAARVILNDPLDMYTKAHLEQTPLEAATWTKAASAPYPPAVLLAEAGLYAVGARLGIGLYGMVLLVAIAFVGLSAYYFLQTRWYLFPVLYLNFSYFSWRFASVQDCSYLVMLVTIMAALLLARAGRPLCHALMAVAIDMKLSPLFYVTEMIRMKRRTAVLFGAILCAGLILPWFIWDHYADIFLFHDEIKGGPGGFAAGIVFAGLFSVLLWYVESRRGFDLEERIGWGLVPFGMFLAMKMNVPRHLLILLLVPDKRGARNLIAAFSLAVPIIVPGARFGAALPVASVLLFGVLGWHLNAIGWDTVRHDLTHPGQTLRLLLARPIQNPA